MTTYDHFIEELCQNIPEEWDDDIAAEAIILNYVRHLESLVPLEARLPSWSGTHIVLTRNNAA